VTRLQHRPRDRYAADVTRSLRNDPTPDFDC
jgi:hypothetical protein